MPALPPVPSTLRFDFVYTVGEDISVTQRVFMGYSGSVPTSTVLDTYAEGAATAENANLAILRHPTTVLTEVVVTDLASDTGARGSFTADVVGLRTGGPLPVGVTALINYGIARRYRGGKPRGYWPLGTDTDLLNATLWDSAFIVDVSTGYADFIGDLEDDTVSGTTTTVAVNVSYYDGFTSVESPTTHRWRNIPTVRTSVPTPDPLESYQCSPKPGSQRRRYQR